MECLLQITFFAFLLNGTRLYATLFATLQRQSSGALVRLGIALTPLALGVPAAA